jgi:hypothetical protein
VDNCHNFCAKSSVTFRRTSRPETELGCPRRYMAHIDVIFVIISGLKHKTKKLRGLLSASDLYRLSDRHLSAKFGANFCS